MIIKRKKGYLEVIIWSTICFYHGSNYC